MSHPHVVERRLLGVENHEEGAQAVDLLHLNIPRRLKLRNHVGRHVRREFQGTRLQLCHAGGVFRDASKDQTLDCRRSPPVVGERLQRDPVATLPADERVRTGSRRARVKALVAHLLDHPLRDDRDQSKAAKKGSVRLAKLDLHRLPVDCFDQCHALRVNPMVRFTVRRAHSLQREHHVIDRQRITIVERHALPDLQPQRCVVDVRVFFGKERLELEVVTPHQERLHHVDGSVKGQHPGGHRGVQVRDLGALRDRRLTRRVRLHHGNRSRR